jgi:hypothetical protein
MLVVMFGLNAMKTKKATWKKSIGYENSYESVKTLEEILLKVKIAKKT